MIFLENVQSATLMDFSRPSVASSSHCSKVPHSLSSSCADVPVVTKANDIELLSTETRLSSNNSTLPSDAADLFILLCYFILISVSIILSGLIFAFLGADSFLDSPLPAFQRLIATFSVSITTAVMVVIGKRYVLIKLAKEGLRSRRVAVYHNPSAANIASHLVLHGVEFPLLGLLVVWALALATSLTANDIWEMGFISNRVAAPTLSGSLNLAHPNSSYILAASEQLAGVMSSLCFRQVDVFGIINVTSVNIVEANQRTGVIYYPAPPQLATSVGFSYSTTINGFNISMEQLSSFPSTARNITCTKSLSSLHPELWFDGSDNQTLSIIVADSSEPPSIFRFNATTIIVGGILSSTGNDKDFALNGTSWPNVMAIGDQWAQDITTLICNTTCPSSCGICISSLFDFADQVNTWSQYPQRYHGLETIGLYQIVSSALGMALGAYSSVVLPSASGDEYITIKVYDSVFTTRYGIYIFIPNTVVSIVMLVVALRLRAVSGPLGPDFINSTRLLLDPLKKPVLFNASLDMTVQALDDPCVAVKEDNVFLLAEKTSAKPPGRGPWIRMFFLDRLNSFSRRTDSSARIHKNWHSKHLRLKNLKDISVTQVEPIQELEGLASSGSAGM